MSSRREKRFMGRNVKIPKKKKVLMVQDNSPITKRVAPERRWEQTGTSEDKEKRRGAYLVLEVMCKTQVF